MKMRLSPSGVRVFALCAACVCGTAIAQTPAASPDEIRAITRDAFIYAYPMLYNYKTLYVQAVDTSAKEYVGGFGKFRQYSQPYTPANKEIVTPNNDTPYSWAWLDLRAEPWVLCVPALPKERYNVFQFVDLFTFNYAYVGVRATGPDAGCYLFPGPGWSGAPPPDIKQVFPSETSFVGMLGRTSENGPTDVKAVQALQAQYKLMPLSTFLKQQAPAPAP